VSAGVSGCVSGCQRACVSGLCQRAGVLSPGIDPLGRPGSARPRGDRPLSHELPCHLIGQDEPVPQ
jgi:hypothetical protein